MIPKILHFIWLGNPPPKYAEHSINAFKEVNPEFRINFAYIPTRRLEDIWFKKRIENENEQVAYDSVGYILTRGKYREYIEHQLRIYGGNLRFIQFLSDVMRLELVNRFGGIYLDTDAFPVNPFDDGLLALRRFIVVRHYQRNFIQSDNYFFGSEKDFGSGEFKFPFGEKPDACQIIQTTPGWNSDLKFLRNKMNFFNCKLKIGEWSLNPDFYIDHFVRGNWNTSSGKPVSTPISRFDLLDLKNRVNKN